MLIVDDQSTWPEHIVKQLKNESVMQLLKSNNYYDDIKQERDIRDIVADVEKYAFSVGVAVYHCTKQLPERPYKTTGLRILNIEVHHSECLKYIRPEVDKSCFDRMKKALAKWNDHEERTRENKICLCLDRTTVFKHGTECFFKYFGGEALYMPFIYKKGMEDIKRILENIGEPVVVEAHLFKSDVESVENPFGKLVVKCFAESINPDFIYDSFGSCCRKDITPDKIKKVYPYEKFKELFDNSGQR